MCSEMMAAFMPLGKVNFAEAGEISWRSMLLTNAHKEELFLVQWRVTVGGVYRP